MFYGTDQKRQLIVADDVFLREGVAEDLMGGGGAGGLSTSVNKRTVPYHGELLVGGGRGSTF